VAILTRSGSDELFLPAQDLFGWRGRINAFGAVEDLEREPTAVERALQPRVGAGHGTAEGGPQPGLARRTSRRARSATLQLGDRDHESDIAPTIVSAPSRIWRTSDPIPGS